MRTHEKFDIIESDPGDPSTLRVRRLYSYEYFQLLKRCLNRGGFAVTMDPTKRTINTFLKVFPYVLSSEWMLIGSNEPIKFDKREMRSRINQPAIRAYFDRVGIDLAPFRKILLQSQLIDLSHYDRSHLEDINTDLFPKDELRIQVEPI